MRLSLAECGARMRIKRHSHAGFNFGNVGAIITVALSDSFEYLCYGYTMVLYIFTFTVRGSTLDVKN